MIAYSVLLVAVLTAYVSGCIFIKSGNENKAVVNAVFAVTTFLLYVFGVIRMYIVVGPYDWNFLESLPTTNVSPFTFCLTLVSLILPKKIRAYVFTLISLLSLAMAAAGVIICLSYVFRDYSFHLTIAGDIIAHFSLSLFGIYLLRSGQIKTSVFDMIVSGGIIVFVALVMLILNLIFGTSFFGLSLYGDHNIYHFVVTKSGVLSALIYFSGLITLLFAGRFYLLLFEKKEK